MFGKGGTALSIWIKEFCELVFIQTLQAFIYAIVIGFICTVLKNTSGLSSDDHNTSVGIICVIALTAIFKVEDLARKIFGFGPTKADHGNAITSLAKTGFALKMAKNVTDNGLKVLGGVGTLARSPLKKLKANQSHDKKLEAYDKDHGITRDEKGNPILGGDTSDGNSSGDAKIDASKRDINSARRQQIEAENYRQMAQKEKDPKKKQELEALAQNGAKSLPKDYYQKMNQFKSERNKEIEEINKNKREAMRNIARGLTESTGAVIGFTTGAIIGGADGDLKEAIQGGMIGMGAGDSIGKATVDIPAGIEDYIRDVKSDFSALKKSSRNTSSYSSSTPKIKAPSSKTTITTPNMPNLDKAVDEFTSEAAKANSKIVEDYEREVTKAFDDASAAMEDIAKSGAQDTQAQLNRMSSAAEKEARNLRREQHSGRNYSGRSSGRTRSRAYGNSRGLTSGNDAVARIKNQVKAMDDSSRANIPTVDDV